MPDDFTPYQQKIIKRYYENIDTIALQRLSELVTEIYLSTGKKQQRFWQTAIAHLKKLGIPAYRIDHIEQKMDVCLLADLVKELQSKDPKK